VNKRDLIAAEHYLAATYEREARARAKKYPALAAQLMTWSDASRKRAETMRVGPLFGGKE
jgi:hypothetical protein